MAVTQNTYTGNGTTVLYSFTFPYLDTSHIKVEVNGAATTAYTLANATTIQFNTAPANGADIRIYRNTDDSQLSATFFPGSAIRSQDLNEDFNQSLYIAQETRNETANAVAGQIADGSIGTSKIADNSVTTAKIADNSVTTAKIVDGTIVNNDVNDNAAISATKLSFTQAGTGAVTRILSAKLQDTVSVKDFGAVGDGVTNDTAALQAAITAVVAAGGGRIDFEPKTYVVSSLLLNACTKVALNGNGASIKKVAGSGSNSLLIEIKGGSKHIEIYGFSDLDGGYDSTNTTTGSNPVILIGDQSGGGDGGATNENIIIRNNSIRRSNWGGIVVYGRSGNAGTPTPLNRNIFIRGNVITDCGGNGVFIYKNASGIYVEGNSIDTIANNGVAFDTMAASDSLTTEPIVDVVVANNVIRNFGKTGQGIGILFKGNITNFSAIGNSISNGLVQPSGSFVNYGIFPNKDAAGAGVKNGTISGNRLTNIKSSSSGLGIVVGSESARVSVTGNSVHDCTGVGIQVLDNVSSCTVTGNVVSQAGNASFGYRFEGLVAAPITDLVVSGNVYKKLSSTAIGGFRFDYVNNLIQSDNLASDFTSSAFSVTNSTFVRSLREFSATAIPTSGTYAQGDIVINPTATTINPVDRWRCTVAGTPGTWRPVSWIVGRAPTANRPTLTASDIGVTYMDTTLDIDGKTIWWNGTAWVDATGAVV